MIFGAAPEMWRRFGCGAQLFANYARKSIIRSMSLHNADAGLSRAVDILNTPHKSLSDLLISGWTQGLSRVSPTICPKPCD